MQQSTEAIGNAPFIVRRIKFQIQHDSVLRFESAIDRDQPVSAHQFVSETSFRGNLNAGLASEM
jgi:hypothetical protein